MRGTTIVRKQLSGTEYEDYSKFMERVRKAKLDWERKGYIVVDVITTTKTATILVRSKGSV